MTRANLTAQYKPQQKNKAKKHLRKLMQLGPSHTEADVQRNWGNFLEALGLHPLSEYSTPTGQRIDSYTPERNFIAELKKPGTFGKTTRSNPKTTSPLTQSQQTHGYVHTIAQQQSQDLPYYSCITDGLSGAIYKYSANGTNPQVIADWPMLDSTTPEKVLDLFIGPDGPLTTITGKPHASENMYQLVFEPHEQSIHNLYQHYSQHLNPSQFQKNVGTKKDLWLKQMQTSGLAPTDLNRQHEMFIHHTFLTAVAKLVNASLDQPTTGPTSATPTNIGLNEDFSAWLNQDPKGQKIIDDLWKDANRYDWQSRPQDVLRHLYQDCIPTDLRKLFGEHYTPDWLAEKIVLEALDNEWCVQALVAANQAIDHDDPSYLHGIGVLDPTCGSGTLLFHAARRLAHHPWWNNQKLNETTEQGRKRIANTVASLVLGIDIHPVAITMAQVSVRRALPAKPDALMIAEGDSLLVDDSLGQLACNNNTLATHSPKGNPINIPYDLIHHPNTHTILQQIMQTANQMQPFSNTAEIHQSGLYIPNLQQLHKQLTTIIQTEGNSVWTWFLTALMHPHKIKHRGVNRIIGNPPWVTINNLKQKPRQDRMKDLAKELNIAVGGKHVSSFDICAIFLKQIWQNLIPQAAQNPKAIFITPYSIAKGENWEPYRDNSPELIHIWNMQGIHKRPFRGAHCAVAILDGTQPRKPKDHIKLTKYKTKTTISNRDTYQTIHPTLQATETVTEPFPVAPSQYKPEEWHTGCRLSPHCLIKLKAPSLNPSATHVQATTVRSRHNPWAKMEPQKVSVPKQWIQPSLNNDNLHNFIHRPPPPFIVPTDGKKILAHQAALKEPAYQKLNHIYQQYRGPGGNTGSTLIDCINHNNKTTNALKKCQDNKHLVVYNKSGTNITATIIQKTMTEDNLMVYGTNNLNDAKYLATVINANCLQKALIETQRSDRDYHKHIWRRLPIPRYDAKVPLHRQIAQCFDKAQKIARKQLDTTLSRKKQNQKIRNALHDSGIMGKIDDLVRQLLPNHTTPPKSGITSKGNQP